VERGAGDRRRQAPVGNALELPDADLSAELWVSDDHQGLPPQMEPATIAELQSNTNPTSRQIKTTRKKVSILPIKHHAGLSLWLALRPEDRAVFLGEEAQDVRAVAGEQRQVPKDGQGRRPRHAPDTPVWRVEVEQEEDADGAGRHRGGARQP
jgi:hypothetical protein